MSYIKTGPIQNLTVLRLYSERDTIKLDPEYQRYGDIWTLEKKMLLIDSILNDYDIPKIYFHTFDRNKRMKDGIIYSVIDGRQRLETIWQFIDDKFSLDDKFNFFDDPDVNLSGLTYSDLANHFPKIKIKFDSFVLPIIGVETDDDDLIEDMFSRLNEAVPLNAAEKRNALGGDMAAAIRKVSNHSFFKNKVKVNNNRYQHFEIAARFLLLVESLERRKKIIDTKKIHLDLMTKDYKKGKKKIVSHYVEDVNRVLEIIEKIFVEKDNLLQAQGNMVPYFLLFYIYKDTGQLTKITRQKIHEFVKKVKNNRKVAEKNISDADYDLLEYDRLTQQGTNDASNIKERVSILSSYLGLQLKNTILNQSPL